MTKWQRNGNHALAVPKQPFYLFTPKHTQRNAIPTPVKNTNPFETFWYVIGFHTVTHDLLCRLVNFYLEYHGISNRWSRRGIHICCCRVCIPLLLNSKKLATVRVAPFYFENIVYISGNSARVSVSSVTSVYLSGLRVGTLPSLFFFYKLHFHFWFWLPRGLKKP